jgi:hypothetical protein
MDHKVIKSIPIHEIIEADRFDKAQKILLPRSLSFQSLFVRNGRQTSSDLHPTGNNPDVRTLVSNDMSNLKPMAAEVFPDYFQIPSQIPSADRSGIKVHFLFKITIGRALEREGKHSNVYLTIIWHLQQRSLARETTNLDKSRVDSAANFRPSLFFRKTEVTKYQSQDATNAVPFDRQSQVVS